jgi:hypothetical protein
LGLIRPLNELHLVILRRLGRRRRMLSGSGRRGRDGRRIEAAPAARLVSFTRPKQHALFTRPDALGMIGGRAADDADGVQLRHVFCNGHELRDRFEWTPEVILIQAGDDDAHAPTGESLASIDKIEVEKLRFVYPNYIRIRSEEENL